MLSELTSSSQPSSAPVAGCVQSAQPSAHVEVHSPAIQLTAVVPVSLHVRSQLPQFAISVSVGVSQPSSMSALQSPWPGSHEAIVHTPSAHPGVPNGTRHGGQSTPPAPPAPPRPTPPAPPSNTTPPALMLVDPVVLVPPALGPT